MGQPFVYTLEIKNTGKTPALALQAYTKIDHLPAGTPAPHDLPWHPSVEHILNPEQENDVGMRSATTVQRSDFDPVKGGQIVLWIRTQIRYDDAFGKRHRIVICSTVNPEDMHSLNACQPGYEHSD